MNLLVYCIFRRGSALSDVNLFGIGGQRVFLVESGGLVAAVSNVRRRPLPVDPAELKTYGNVVGTLHRSPVTGGVIPMRYGNLLAEEAGVRRHLAACEKEYDALLRTVAGCEEMGLRLLLSSPAGDSSAEGDAGCKEGCSGVGYLAVRKRHYAGREAPASERDRLTQRCRVVLDGHFACWKTECRTVTDPRTRQRQVMLSLFFLVPRPNLTSFLQKYRELRSELPDRRC